MLVFLADSPASNYAGGYKESASAYRKCRTCLILPQHLHTKVFVLSHTSLAINSSCQICETKDKHKSIYIYIQAYKQNQDGTTSLQAFWTTEAASEHLYFERAYPKTPTGSVSPHMKTLANLHYTVKIMSLENKYRRRTSIWKYRVIYAQHVYNFGQIAIIDNINFFNSTQCLQGPTKETA